MTPKFKPRHVPTLCRSLLAIACLGALPVFAQTPPSVEPTPTLRAGQTPQDIDPASRTPALAPRKIV